MIFNNADNIMYGDKEVDRVFYGKNLVWERGDFYWISDRQTQSICGYKGVPTSPVCYLNWNQKPTNVSRPFPSYALNVSKYSYQRGNRNILDVELDFYNSTAYDEPICTTSIIHEFPQYLYVNYNKETDMTYCNEIGDYCFTGICFKHNNDYSEVLFRNCKLKRIGKMAFSNFTAHASDSNFLIFGGDEDTAIIEKQAFLNSNWNIKVVFDCSNIKVSKYAFVDNNISEIIFKKPVQYIEIADDSFRNCDNITNLVLPDGITKIKNNFYQCSKLSNVILPESLIEIGENFLSNTNIESIFIPKDVSKIDKTALIQTTKVSGWESSENIYRIFKSFSVSFENPYFATSDDGILYDKNFTTLYKVPCGKFNEYEIQINDYINGNNSQADIGTPTIYEFPNTLKRVEDYCMYNVTGGNYVFVLPDTVEYVGNLRLAGSCNTYDYNFVYLRFSKFINIPSKVKIIGDYAYSSLYHSGNQQYIVTIGNIPDTVESIGKYAFSDSEFRTSYSSNDEINIMPHIPENSKFTTIPLGCFRRCKNFYGANIKIPDNIKTIKTDAFEDCNLSSVIIPKSVLEIGDSSFYSYRGFPLFYIYHDSYGENYVKYIAGKYAQQGYTITYEYLD